MAEYIDRNALIEHIRKDPLFDLVEQYGITGVIESFPAADVQPVKHGRWELGKSGNDFIGYPVYNCSVCGYWNEDVYGFLYCPNCGAKMERS